MKNDAILCEALKNEKRVSCGGCERNRGSGRCNGSVGVGGFGNKFNLGNKREFQTGAPDLRSRHFFN